MKMSFKIILFVLLVSAFGFSETHAAVWNFNLSNSGGITVIRGSSGANTITATKNSGTPLQSISSFSASGLPSGASASFSPTTCTPTCSTTLTISTTNSTPTGTHTITVTAVSSGGITKTTGFTLTVLSGPVGWWKFDEGLGLTTNDSSANGNTLNLINGSAWTEGKTNSGINFDGIDDKVNGFPVNPAFGNMPAVTVSAWIYPRTQGNELWGPIANTATGACRSEPTEGWTFGFDGYSGISNGKLCFAVDYAGGSGSGGGDLEVSTSQVMTLNEWQHVAVTWNGSANANSVRIYRNGGEVSYSLRTNGTGNRVIETAPNIIIGSANDPAVFDGCIDDVRVFDRSLSSSEISAIFSEVTGPSGTCERMPVGDITVNATLDGAPWSGAVNYTLTGPATINGTTVSSTHANQPAGIYTLSYVNGGPIGAIYNSITPVSSQTLLNGTQISYTINFVTGDYSTIDVCVAVADSNGNINTGSGPGTIFTIPGLPVGVSSVDWQMPDTQFETPINFNYDAFGNDGVEDVQCTRHINPTFELSNCQNQLYCSVAGYGEETISSGSWLPVLYDDEFSYLSSSLNNFSVYELDGPNPNSNGLIHSNGTNLHHRYLVVLNRMNSSLGTVNAKIYRVGDDELISSAPLNTFSKFGNSNINIENPSIFTDQPLGNTTAHSSYVSGYDVSVGECSYNVGSLECDINSYPVSCPSAQCVLENGFWGLGTDVQSGKVRKVEFKYSRVAPPDFALYSLNVNPIRVTLSGSGMASTKTWINVTSFNNFDQDISLSVASINPAIDGVQWNFSDAILSSAEYSIGSEFNISIPASTTPGTYFVTIQGDSAGFTPRSMQVEINVFVRDPEFKEVMRDILRYLAGLFSIF